MKSLYDYRDARTIASPTHTYIWKEVHLRSNEKNPSPEPEGTKEYVIYGLSPWKESFLFRVYYSQPSTAALPQLVA